jgi:RNA polymerase sigma-70 factor (ECF subfamily)
MIDWPALVRDHGPAVWRTVYRLVGNRADADECFQETFASALALTRASSEPVRQWHALLVRLAVARGIDRLRQRVRRTSQEEAGHEAERLVDRRMDSRPQHGAEQSELSERLRIALSHLPSKQADAFCLNCLEGWSYRETAEQLETTTDHVGVLIHRARAALRAQIDLILPEHSSIEASTRPADAQRSSPTSETQQRGEL